MTDLTEQWRKGELPDGWYWVKKKTCEEYIDKVYFWYDTFIDGDVPLDNDKVIEVLAHVPSYEEWQALNGNMDSTMQTNKALCKKLAELKELLRECRNSLEEQSNVRKLYESDVEYRDRYNKKMDLLIKLDEVLK